MGDNMDAIENHQNRLTDPPEVEGDESVDLMSTDELDAIISLHLPLPPYDGFQDYKYRVKLAAAHINREINEREETKYE